MPARATNGKTTAAVSSLHPPAGIEVLRITPRDGAAERVPLFYVGDTEFTMPAHPGANIALEYMEILAGSGDSADGAQKAEAQAYTYLFRKMLGDDGYKALKDCDDLTMADLGQLISILVKHTMGALEAPKGQRASA
jgi:hypothetical protein